MNRTFFIAISAIIFPYYVGGAEPSAFGAGDLNNPNPYGLTTTEEVLLKTKENLKKVIVKSNNQANEVNSLRERIDGLQSILENISTTTHENKLTIKKFAQEDVIQKQNRDQHDQRVAKSLQENSDMLLLHKEEIQKIKTQITEIAKLVDTINTGYVHKDEFNALVDDVNNFKKTLKKELQTKPKKSSFADMTNAEIATKAQELFDKKLYTDAIKYYEYLIENHYKPARAHYMIGEMYYYRKNYAEAIAYFKKSASLYSKADYMPFLLLHTAISMDSTGDKENAKTFYNAVVAQYPKSKQARTAKEKLNTIKK